MISKKTKAVNPKSETPPLSARKNYETPERFRSPDKQTQLEKLINNITTILTVKSDDYFKNSREILGIGLKKEKDKCIVKLKKLILSTDFKQYLLTEQYEKIKEIIEKNNDVPSLFITRNENITIFIEAIKSANHKKINKILFSITQDNHWLNQPNDLIKEQALVTANLWLNTFKKAIELTPAQEQIFTSTLADETWQTCYQSSSESLCVNYQSIFIQNALTKAHIRQNFILPKELKELNVIIFNDGDVEVKSNSLYSIKIYGLDPLDKLYQAPSTNRVSHNLPEDNIIRYRDMLSTITTGIPEECNFYFLSKLPKTIKNYKNSFLLVGQQPYHVKPNGLAGEVLINDITKFMNLVEILFPKAPLNKKLKITENQIYDLITSNGGYTGSTKLCTLQKECLYHILLMVNPRIAKEQIIWNQNRFINQQTFFKSEKPLLKIGFPSLEPIPNTTKQINMA